ncbi:MAG: ribosome maturation factor RimM [Flavobacteriales bacterium]|nr:ribosome maturation factor RimM [Flavobacteriales bacterium]
METPQREDLHCLGYFSRLHGYKGELTANLDTPDIKDYEDLKHIFVDIRGQLIPFFIELIEYKTNTTAKVKLEGIDSEEKAKQLVKCSIYIQPEDLSETDHDKVALRSLEGFQVMDEEKGNIGKVLRIEELNNNPLMVIMFGKKEILLPLHEDFFRKIDRKKKVVEIAAPPGLIDFYLEQ